MKIRRFATKALVVTVLAFAAVPATAGLAYAAPHSEQADGSDHGNSNKPAREDPQPNKGKDCEVHGKWGGVNEDHCDAGPGRQ